MGPLLGRDVDPVGDLGQHHGDARAVLDGRRPRGVVVGGDDDPLVGRAGQGADDVVGDDLVPAGVDVEAPGDRAGVEQAVQLDPRDAGLSHRPLIGRATPS